MEKLRLFHASEEPGITTFVPRPVPNPDAGVSGEAVWAVDQAHLPNYLLPRNCPRVTFCASAATSQADKERFIFGTGISRVVAVESAWLAKIKSCGLYLYEFPIEDFELVDAGAGYYISRKTITPLSLTKIDDLVSELLRWKAEVRILPNLWDLRDAVVGSTLEFSVIRFRNAQPRPER